MEAILKNQLRQVSLAVSFTSSTVKESEEDKSTDKMSIFFDASSTFKQQSYYLAKVSDQNTWSRSFQTPAGL